MLRVTPAALVATARYLYRVSDAQAGDRGATVTVELPAPIACSGVALPYDVEVPYSKRTLVASARGFTRARRSRRRPTPPAERPEIDGAAPGRWSTCGPRRATPDAFVATMR